MGTKKRTADIAFEFTTPAASDSLPKRPKIPTESESDPTAMSLRSSLPRRYVYAQHLPGDTAKVVPSNTERAAPKPDRRQIVQLSDDVDTITRRMNE